MSSEQPKMNLSPDEFRKMVDEAAQEAFQLLNSGKRRA